MYSLIEVGHLLNIKGLCPATSGNLSERVDEKSARITASGTHLGHLTSQDFVVVDWKGRVQEGDRQASAETLLHTSLYASDPTVGAVIHMHSINATLLSRKIDAAYLKTTGYELHKAFRGVETHQSDLLIPIIENSQDIPSLAAQIESSIPPCFGYLLRGHGLYTWGRDIQEAYLRVEAFEFLFACEIRCL